MKRIDLAKLNKKTILEIKKSEEYFLAPNFLKNTSLKKKCYFQFEESNMLCRIVYRAVAEKNVNIDLEISLSSIEEDIKDVDVFLEIYILNLDESNNIVVKPFLETPQKEIKFEHKVTIGTPNQNWIKYLKSRGLTYNQALKLVSESFITGQ